MMMPPSLATLSNELLLEIAEHLESDSESTSPNPTSLKNLSLVNRHFRWLLKSLVMRSVVLNKETDSAGEESLTRYQMRVVWKQMHEAIHFLSEDLNTLMNIRKLQFEIPQCFWIDTPNRERRPFNVIRQFLTGLPHLEHLHVQATDNYSFRRYEPSGSPYSKVSAEEIFSLVPPLRFDNVATLVIDLSMIKILEHCPRIQRLGLLNHDDNHRLAFIGLQHYAQFAPNVSHVEAMCRWYTTEIQCLAETWPDLHHLGILTTDHMVPRIDRLLKGLCRSFRYLKVLKLTGLCIDLSTGGRIEIRNFFRVSGNIYVHYMFRLKRHKLSWASFLHERGGDKMMKDVMESVFCNLRGLDECRIGDAVGARRVWGDDPSDYSEELIEAHGDDDLDRQIWTLRFNWLEHAELCGPVQGEQGGGWLLRPVWAPAH
jgi:hypothetical protein